MILSKLCIYVENYKEWIDLQEYLFTQGMSWSYTNGQKLYKTWSDDSEIIFPRNVMIGSNKNIFNGGMNGDDRFKNEFKLKEVNGKALLRKLKLEKLKQ